MGDRLVGTSPQDLTPALRTGFQVLALDGVSLELVGSDHGHDHIRTDGGHHVVIVG